MKKGVLESHHINNGIHKEYALGILSAVCQQKTNKKDQETHKILRVNIKLFA